MPNRHLQTIVPGLFRKIENIPSYQRERIDTPDGDFLDLDWIKNEHSRLVVISHGLEGDSGRPYMRGMAREFVANGWDALAWNFRGCSGEMNNKASFYHSGFTSDLEAVIGHAVAQGYDEIVLVGFSLGGNLILKYLGEPETQKFDQLVAAVVFSVPIDLASGAREINLPHNILYSQRFLKSLKKKINDKKAAMPDDFPDFDLTGLNSIYNFDNQVTAPMHGFDSADHYYRICSAMYYLKNIQLKTLVVNAANDPFLSKSCLDDSLFTTLENVYFEKPDHGGHVGFSSHDNSGVYWSERRAVEFVNEIMEKNAG